MTYSSPDGGKVNLDTGPERLDRFLSHLKGVKRTGGGYIARCPAHDDKSPSLRVWLKNEWVGFKCYTGCDSDSILAALGFARRDLGPAFIKASWKPTAVYDYRDTSGKLMLRRLRFNPPDGRKIFQWWAHLGNDLWRCALHAGWYKLWDDANYHPVKAPDPNNPGEKVRCDDPNKKPCEDARWFDEVKERTIYRAVAVAALRPGDTVLYFEGEKDVENFEKLNLGIVATTAGGASDWRAEFAGFFTDLNLVFVPDNDRAGEGLLAKVAADCRETAESVRVLRLDDLPGKGDLSDWIETGGTGEQFLRRLREAPEWEPEAALDEATKKAVERARKAIEAANTPVESEKYDPQLSSNPDAEKKLRRIARESGRLVDLMLLIMGFLGFRSTHHRFLTALLAYARGLKTSMFSFFSVSNLKLYGKYVKRGREFDDAKDDSKAQMVYRDAKALREEQEDLRVNVVDIQKGQCRYDQDKEAKELFAPKYRLQILRYALIAQELSDSIRKPGEPQWKADEEAAKIVAGLIPRQEPSRDAEMREKTRTAAAKNKRRKDEPGVTRETVYKHLETLFDDMIKRAKTQGTGIDVFSEETDRIAQKLQEITLNALSRAVVELSSDSAASHADKFVGMVSDGEGEPETAVLGEPGASERESDVGLVVNKNMKDRTQFESSPDVDAWMPRDGPVEADPHIGGGPAYQESLMNGGRKVWRG